MLYKISAEKEILSANIFYKNMKNFSLFCFQER